MTPAEESANAPTTSAGNGKSSRASLPNAADADARRTAARSVRRVPGPSTVIGVWLPLNDSLSEASPERFVRRHASQPLGLYMSMTLVAKCLRSLVIVNRFERHGK